MPRRATSGATAGAALRFRRARRAVALVAAIAGLATGLAVLAAGAGLLRERRGLAARGGEAAGVVRTLAVRSPVGRAPAGRRVYAVGYAFRAEGAEHAGEGHVDSARFAALEPGAPVAVRYERGRPANHALAVEHAEGGYGAAAAALGFGLVIAGCAGYAALQLVRGRAG